jgi:hypothetical protein
MPGNEKRGPRQGLRIRELELDPGHGTGAGRSVAPAGATSMKPQLPTDSGHNHLLAHPSSHLRPGVCTGHPLAAWHGEAAAPLPAHAGVANGPAGGSVSCTRRTRAGSDRYQSSRWETPTSYHSSLTRHWPETSRAARTPNAPIAKSERLMIGRVTLGGARGLSILNGRGPGPGGS